MLAACLAAGGHAMPTFCSVGACFTFNSLLSLNICIVGCGLEDQLNCTCIYVRVIECQSRMPVGS